MNLSLLFPAASLYMAAAGLGLILAPAAFGEGAVPEHASPALIAFLRLWGAPLLGIAVLDWRVRHAAPSSTLDAVLLGNLVGFGVIAALDLWGVLGAARPVTWVFLVIHAVFAAAFALALAKQGRI